MQIEGAPHVPPVPSIEIVDGTLVVLVGASGSGKSTFANRRFLPTEILSSDAFRAMLTDDAADQRISRRAFALLHEVAEERLARGRTTVVDATSVQRSARTALLAISAAKRRPAVAIVFDLPIDVCLAWNAERATRRVDPRVVERQAADLRRSLLDDRLAAEGFAAIHVLRDARMVDAVRVVRIRRQPKP